MAARTFEPSPKYLIKLRWMMVIIALIVLASGALMAGLMSLDRSIGARGGWITFVIVAGCNAAWWIPAMLLTKPYYESLGYEIHEDEVLVRVGVWTKAVKHVPYRTVTNLTVKRGLMDRWLGLGTLDIQTAGMSGTNTAEQRLVGMENSQEVYEMVAAELRRFRGGMSPTGAEVESEPISSRVGELALAETLDKILNEVRAIRQALEERA